MWITIEGSKSNIKFQDRSTEELKMASFTLDETKPAYGLIVYDRSTQPDKKGVYSIGVYSIGVYSIDSSHYMYTFFANLKLNFKIRDRLIQMFADVH